MPSSTWRPRGGDAPERPVPLPAERVRRPPASRPPGRPPRSASAPASSPAPPRRACRRAGTCRGTPGTPSSTEPSPLPPTPGGPPPSATKRPDLEPPRRINTRCQRPAHRARPGRADHNAPAIPCGVPRRSREPPATPTHGHVNHGLRHRPNVTPRSHPATASRCEPTFTGPGGGGGIQRGARGADGTSHLRYDASRHRSKTSGFCSLPSAAVVARTPLGGCAS